MRMKRKMLQRFLSTTFNVSNHASIRYLQYLHGEEEEETQWTKEEIELGKKRLLNNLKQCRHYARGKGKAVVFKTHKMKYIVSRENTIITFIPKNRKKESLTLFESENEG